MTYTEFSNTLHLGLLCTLKTYYTTYIFIVPNTKLNCWGKKKKERDRFIQDIQRKGKKHHVFLLHGTKGCKLRPKHQDTEVLQQSAIFINPYCAHIKYSLLTIGLFIYSVKMVLSRKQLLCHHLLLRFSVGDLRQRQAPQGVCSEARHVGLLSNMLG